MVKAVAIITVSDSCFKDNSQDTSGPALLDFLTEKFPEANIHTIIVPDEKEIIERELKYFCDSNIDLILTTGGTGLSPRDVTPEATKAIIQREVPAIPIAMTIESLKKTPMAMLSRAVAGIKDRTLIINFPGSKKAVTECIEVVKVVLAHAISLINNELSEVRTVHDKLQVDHICPHKRNSAVDLSKVALRPRESPYPMMEMQEAFNTVDAVMLKWVERIEVLPLEECTAHVVAQGIIAKEPFPPFPASVKDGYACLSLDGAGTRKVRAAVTAGETPCTPLAPGECARINTGAPLPLGADCVVQVEDTKLILASDDHKTELEIEVLVAPQPHQDVRPIGFDIPVGSMLVEKGDVIGAAQIGILAGAGYQSVPILAYPKEVVGVTCLGAAHPMLARTTFDVCIVDEATQVLQCTVLRPLFAAKRFVLVGDPEQLPPVVRSKSARRLGMEESLFHRLIKDDVTCTLRLQYRMNQALVEVANKVAYNNSLKCADQKVAQAQLKIDMQKISLYSDESPWLITACSPEFENAAVFLNTIIPPTAKSNTEKVFTNSDEACVVLDLVETFKQGGVFPSHIGVIAPYRDQVSLLRRALSGKDVEVSTVDQFQGRDKSVIIYSCTKCVENDERRPKDGEVLNDQRRLAVSVTRAKHKLIVIGNLRALQRYAPLIKLIESCRTVTLEEDTVARLNKKYGTFVV